VPSASEQVLMSRLVLCAGAFPCALSLVSTGSPGGIVNVRDGGSFACLGSSGCLSLAISGVRFDCSGKDYLSPFSAIEVAGTQLVLFNTTMAGCWSESDGGSVKAYAGARVQVRFPQTIHNDSQGFKQRMIMCVIRSIVLRSLTATAKVKAVPLALWALC
jgi:hypothetical protein